MEEDCFETVFLHTHLKYPHTMCFRILLLWLLPLWSTVSLTADIPSDELPEILSQLAATVGEVKTAKTTYVQSFSYDREYLWRVELQVEVVNNRNGKTESLEYQLNLGDLDPNLIQVVSKSDEMTVRVGTDRKQSMIRYFEDGEQENYESELIIYAPDIDVAREIEKLLKAAIEPARVAWEASIHIEEDWPSLCERLKTAAGPARSANDRLEQHLGFDETYPDRVKLAVREAAKGGNYVYHFSLADLSATKLEMDVRGTDVMVRAETGRKREFISLEEEGVLSSYEDEVVFYFDEVDEARVMLRLLQTAIPLAESRRAQRLPSPAGTEEALQALTGQIQSFNKQKEGFEQSMEPRLRTTYRRTSIDLDKGDREAQQFRFHFADLDPTRIEVDIRGDEINLQVSAKNKQRFIQVTEKGTDEYQFEDELEIPAASIENARYLAHLLPIVIDSAREEPVKAAGLDWLIGAVSQRVGEYEQELDREPADEDCKLRFSRRETDGRNPSEEIFEFNLYDLNPYAIEFDISRKELALELVTLHEEEIIKYYDDGDPGFTEKFTILFDDLLTARRARKTLEALISGCEK